jgi:hypothetical protein
MLTIIVFYHLTEVRLLIDPPTSQINTLDGITGAIDVSLECQVINWENKHDQMVNDTCNIKDRVDHLYNRINTHIVRHI